MLRRGRGGWSGGPQEGLTLAHNVDLRGGESGGPAAMGVTEGETLSWAAAAGAGRTLMPRAAADGLP